MTPVLVLVIAALMGLVRPSDLGVRAALVADTMPREQLMAAMGISRTTSDCARIGGALTGAGLFAAFGMGPAYVAVDGVLRGGPGAHARDRQRDGRARRGGAGGRHGASVRLARSARGRHLCLDDAAAAAAMLLAFLVNLTAYPLSNGLLPYVAKEIYLLDQTGLGYLVASFSLGALLGSVAVSMRGGLMPGAHDDRVRGASGTRCWWCSRRCECLAAASSC